MTAKERALAAAALRWAMRSGWRRRHPRVFVSPDGWTELYLQQGCLCVATRTDQATARTFVTPASVTEAVSILATLQVLPARFSDLGRAALLDHSVALLRFAAHLRSHQSGARTADEKQLLAGRITGIVDAADAAVARARPELPVVPAGVYW